jgi:hypothetical protein
VAVAIIAAPDTEPVELRRWFDDSRDLHTDPTICGEVAVFLRQHDVRSVAMVDAIIGCPHEEGVDYPLGTDCPQCPFWAGRDRWAGARRP